MTLNFSPLGGLPEFVYHGVNGIIREVETAEALVASVASLLENEECRHAAGRAARVDFEARFGPARFAPTCAEGFFRLSGGSSRERDGHDGERP